MDKKGQIGDALKVGIIIILILAFFILLIAAFIKKIDLGVPG